MQRIPSVFRINPDGKEATADYSVHESTVIAPGTAQEWVLRDGNTVLAIYDLTYNPMGSTPGTHTISPSVVRAVREDKDGH
jgi:type IV secretion system protein VirB9